MKAVRKWLVSFGPKPRIEALLGAALLLLLPSARAITAPQFDFGDAPKPYPAAWHQASAGLVLGRRIDVESGTQANDTATGDDISPAGVASDEDGVTFTTNPLAPGQTATVQVELLSRAQTGILDAWIDFNRNGTWNDKGEQIFASQRLVSGINTLTFTVPSSAAEGTTFARFRLSSKGGLAPDGLAADGEVEDYMIQIKKPVQLLDYGDAPEKYPVLLSQDGARHVVIEGFFLGKLVDLEPDGQPSSLANGDDSTATGAPGDEDGVVFLTPLIAGSEAQVQVTLSNGKGFIDAWVDFDGNSSWLDKGEKVIDSQPVVPGPNIFKFIVPSTAITGTTFSRFRLSLQGGLAPTGIADSGEVEDYAVSIQRDQLDFGDAPQNYPVTLAQDGARHRVSRDVFLGRTIDDEADGQPSNNADADDLNPLGATDDEDGVKFLTDPLIVGDTAQVQITASTAGFIDAWIDFNKNGSWNDPGEQIFTSARVNGGLNTLSFTVPSAALDVTAARFRFSLKGGLKPTGLASEGEVEDYMIRISRTFMDYGDAPQNYPVTFAQNGARHTVLQGFYLGKGVDPEFDGIPSPDASGDDADAGDDEDGVIFPSGNILAGQSATVQVIASREGGLLDAWIDFNRNGSWAEENEKIFSAKPLAPGVNTLTFNVPADAVSGVTFSRFRLSTKGGLSFTGFGGDGEVEDYPVTIDQVQLDFGDAPQQYPTLLAQDGARHRIVKGISLGKLVDPDKDGQPSANADGDDLNPSTADDEDGVRFVTDPLPAGQTAQVEVISSIAEARLDAWVDFNRNGSWDDPGEQIFTSQPLAAGLNSLSFSVPSGAPSGGTWARFRLSMRGGLKPTGLAPDGEVEDYAIRVESQQLDFGDAPRTYPVLLASDGARHQILQGFYLGKLVDAEADGNPTSAANGDDLVPSTADDEDGVTFLNPLQVGGTAQIQVVASQSGMLDAWVDFNRNGSWDDPGEQIFASRAIAGGANTLAFAVPASASPGENAFARFRFSRRGGLSVRGFAPDGEVEDYQVAITPRSGVPCEPHTHRGTNFWLTFPGNYAPDPDNPVDIRLHIVGPRETLGTVTIPGLGFSTNYIIPASQEKVIVLPKNAELGNSNEQIQDKGIHVTANQEVAVYGMNRVRFTSDGYLGLPTDVIGTQYVVQGYGNEFTGVPDLNGTQFAMVATEDSTVVKITPRVATGAHPGGGSFAITLNRGQTWQFRNTNDFDNDLTGSLIQADKPISLFGSHQCSTVPSSNVFYCDHLVEQLLPVERAGVIFDIAPLATRTASTYRFTATADGTIINLNGLNIAVLNAGQTAERIITGPVHLLASKPVFVAQFANSSDYDGVVNSDPFMIVIPPLSMWLNQYLITAPDLGFAEHYVSIVTPSTAIGTVSLDGIAVPAVQFSAIPGTASSFARMKILPGVHQLASSNPFGATVYGWAQYDSYGFPAGMFFGDTDPPQLDCPDPITVTLTGSVIAGGPSCSALVPDLRSQVKLSDNCGLPSRVLVNQSPAPGTAVGPGVTLITLTSADINGNIGFCQVPFTVIDPTPLRLTCPQDMLVRCTTNGGAFVQYAAIAQRSCGPSDVPISYDPPSGSFFPEGTNTVNVVATDPQNNNAKLTCSFKVIVRCTGGSGNGTISTSFNSGATTFTLSWSDDAILEQADSVSGPWTAVTEAQGSYTVRPTNSKSFYRLRLITP